MGLALAMLAARASVEDKIESVKSSIGSTVTIQPAGVRGFQGGGDPLTTDQLAKVSSIANVTKVSETLEDRLTTENTNLVSAIDAGTLGQRAAGNSGVGFQIAPGGGERRFESGTTSGDGDQVTRTFTPPVTITGTNDLSGSTVYGGDSVTYSSGQAFDAAKDDTVAVVGKSLAEKNSLSVGSTFTAYNTQIKVVGIYDTGNTFSNAGLIMPLTTLQRLSSQTGSVTSATATINSIDNIAAATSAIKSELGDKADVTSSQDSVKEAIDPLESVKTISTFSVIGAVAAGAVIILLTMVMIVRERRREIGVFKAIGGSNLKVMLQFMAEAVTLTVLALVAGVIIGAVAANPITKTLVNNSSSNSSTSQQPDGGPQTVSFSGGGNTSGSAPRAARRFNIGGPGLRGFGNNTLANAKNIQASVGLKTLGLGVLAAFFVAVVGSAIPAFLISKIRPAEVMRAE